MFQSRYLSKPKLLFRHFSKLTEAHFYAKIEEANKMIES